jgi:fatty acid desaturase
MAVTVLARSTPGDRGRGITSSVLRHSPWDAVLVGLSVVHAALLLTVPVIPVIGIGLWWTANTVAHNFIHTPFFRSRRLNRLYSAYLSALMGIPQSLWRDRHLRHHRGQHARGRWTREMTLEAGIVIALWVAIAAAAPRFFATVYLPGYALGLGLCFLQGHFEHARGTTSHYGWLYNWCFFNDGYHAEHHLRPGEHWTRLPEQPHALAHTSRWPPVLRWLDVFSLDSLERVVLRLPWLQRFVVAAHERAFRALLLRVPPVHRVTIIGGGLFPRTALVLQKLLPDATLTIVDARLEHLDVARTFLHGSTPGNTSPKGRCVLRHELFDPGSTEAADLVVIPLSFIGDRDRVYREPAAPAVLVHDWMWKTRGGGVRVSWMLLKRLNLVTR